MPTPLARQVAQDAVDLGLGADVDAARRLVEEDDPRIDRQHLGDAPPSAGCRPTATRPDRRCWPHLRSSRSPSAFGLLGLRRSSMMPPRVATCSKRRAPRRWRRSTCRGRGRRPCGPPTDRRCRRRCCRDSARWRSGLPSSTTSPRDLAFQPADALDDLAAPRADQAGEAEDLALAQLEGDVVKAAALGQVAHLEDASSGLLRLGLLGRVELVDDAADHRVDDVVRAWSRRRRRS